MALLEDSLSPGEGVAKGLWERTLGREEPGTASDFGPSRPKVRSHRCKKTFCDTLLVGERGFRYTFCSR